MQIPTRSRNAAINGFFVEVQHRNFIGFILAESGPLKGVTARNCRPQVCSGKE